ncbi:MAG: tRNA (adenosine(37)-N6)-threonylcarbamoyltransferase complex dimerization subunit type 1 TsaB [Pseudomonadota bacterium]
MRLIALETATERCSAALWLDGEMLATGEVAPRRHGELILGQVEALLAQAGVARSSLDGVAVGRGPGAFTGVRLGLGVAQGLAFALGRPVLPVSTLLALAQQALRDPAPGLDAVLAALDARMGEIYWGLYPVDGGRVEDAAEWVSPPAAVIADWRAPERYGLGSGFAAWPELGPQLELAAEQVNARALPDAREVALLAVDAWERGEAVAPEDAQPVYLRDDVVRPPGRSA